MLGGHDSVEAHHRHEGRKQGAENNLEKTNGMNAKGSGSFGEELQQCFRSM